jgi:hypothetical protein
MVCLFAEQQSKEGGASHAAEQQQESLLAGEKLFDFLQRETQFLGTLDKPQASDIAVTILPVPGGASIGLVQKPPFVHRNDWSQFQRAPVGQPAQWLMHSFD